MINQKDRAVVLMATRVLSTLSAVAIAVDLKEHEQAVGLHHAACDAWDRWRKRDRRRLPDYCAGPLGAVHYLQTHGE